LTSFVPHSSFELDPVVVAFVPAEKVHYACLAVDVKLTGIENNLLDLQETLKKSQLT